MSKRTKVVSNCVRLFIYLGMSDSFRTLKNMFHNSALLTPLMKKYGKRNSLKCWQTHSEYEKRRRLQMTVEKYSTERNT